MIRGTDVAHFVIHWAYKKLHLQALQFGKYLISARAASAV